MARGVATKMRGLCAKSVKSIAQAESGKLPPPETRKGTTCGGREVE